MLGLWGCSGTGQRPGQCLGGTGWLLWFKGPGDLWREPQQSLSRGSILLEIIFLLIFFVVGAESPSLAPG